MSISYQEPCISSDISPYIEEQFGKWEWGGGSSPCPMFQQVPKMKGVTASVFIVKFKLMFFQKKVEGHACTLGSVGRVNVVNI